MIEDSTIYTHFVEAVATRCFGGILPAGQTDNIILAVMVHIPQFQHAPGEVLSGVIEGLTAAVEAKITQQSTRYLA